MSAGTEPGRQQRPTPAPHVPAEKPPTDPLPGEPAFVWFTWQSEEKLPEIKADVTEVVFGRTALGSVVAEVAGVRSIVELEYPADEHRLHRALDRSGQLIALAVASEPMASSRSGARQAHRGRFAVNLYVYERGPSWEPLSIGVGDRPCERIYRMAGLPAGRWIPERAIAWLARRLVLPPPPGAPGSLPARIVVSAGPRERLEAPVAFRIHGRGVAADVKAVGDRLEVTRVVRPSHRQTEGVLRLLHCDVELTDISRATELLEEKKRQVAKLAAGEGFLAMWNEYNRLESQYLTQTVRRLGSARYTATESLRDRTFRFTVTEAPSRDTDGSTLLERVSQMIEVGDSVELEAAQVLPATLTNVTSDGTDVDWGLLDNDVPDESVSGSVVRVDPQARTIDLRLTAQDTGNLRGVGRHRRTQPFPTGFLYLSFRGDRRQMLRRRDAWRRVLRGGTRIPNLLSLLEGEVVDAPARTRIKPLSQAAAACFHNSEPTQMQKVALDVALNTPDIAIIQGPPGTGKTQLITALQTRLAEEGRAYAELRGSMLLTSYQHAAVDELVERSVVFGLPANKIDRAGRGTTVQVDRWRRETINQLAENLRSNRHGRGLQSLRRVAALAAGYLLAPVTGQALGALMREVEELVTDLVAGRLIDRLRDCRGEVELAQVGWTSHASDEQELAVRAVRGLRTTPESFTDDGPLTAAKALRRLRGLDGVAERAEMAGCVDILEKAANWNDDSVPDFLADLAATQERLFDLLATPTGPTVEAVVDPSVAELLNEVTEALTEAVRDSAEDGPGLALVNYLDALEGDPEAVAWTLREYTASYAATCQQVNSPAMADAKQARVGEVEFDTVIVDEAARANPLDLMIPLSHAGRRIILVGDQNQLPHMLEPDVERMFQQRDPHAPGQLKESLFERLFTSLDNRTSATRRVVTLDAQFRMHSTLGDFVSRNFYKGDLSSPLPASRFKHGLPGYGDAVAAWISLPPERGREYGGRSKSRPVEAKRVVDEVVRLLESAPDLTFGVISFYSAQVREIWRELEARDLAKRVDDGYQLADRLRYGSSGQRVDRLHVGSVDAFQGKEFDVVLLAVTRCWAPQTTPPDPASPGYPRWVRRVYGHLILRNRQCVALSRQKRLLIVVGADEMFASARTPKEMAPLQDFLRLCRKDDGLGRFVST